MNVVIADDEPFARERLRDLLAEHADVTVVAEAGDGDAVLQACAGHRIWCCWTWPCPARTAWRWRVG
jgi:DNA-binding NarL/FixJ family response regulator